ncbi:MAG: bis(5'-nucleosyl)-tetraphosphatase (symmetrical) YqeK [Clostridia bacterium]|nr:bis(5'-nucleosyl)-tetraphosphatase (symmetrical) YqeK [Clostridia bacterium]
MKTILFGGSFDPVTSAHTDIIRQLSRRFDRTVVVPCKISPFKTAVSASGEERLRMLALSISKIKAEISDFELMSSLPSYSFITIKHFFSKDYSLYFAMGSEMLSGLDKWKNIKEVLDDVIFYIIPRDGFPVDRRKIYDLKSKGFRIEIADFEGKEGSSSEVKISIAMGSPELFLENIVADYIVSKGLYLDYAYVNDLYNKYGMKESRIRHSFSTALCGVKLAKRLDVDTNKAAIALLLHDIGKYVSREEAEKLGIVFSSEIEKMPKPIIHAEIGAEILSQLEKIEDKEIINAVRYHTTGRPEMSALEKIVYLADYIEPLRAFPGVDKIREATTISIDEGLFAGLANSILHVDEKTLYPLTKSAYDYYKEILNK